MNQQSYKLLCSQVSGKEPKLLSDDEKTILKGYTEPEEMFYRYMSALCISDLAYSFKNFIPKFEGTSGLSEIPFIEHNQKVTDPLTRQWLSHLKQRYNKRNPQNKFLHLENILHRYTRPNALDIKIGTRPGDKLHKNSKFVAKFYFKMNGCRVNFLNRKKESSRLDSSYETVFLSKYHFKKIQCEDQILDHLALFFFDGQKIREKCLSKAIETLKSLILDFRKVQNWKFYSTSLCLFNDAQNDEIYDVKLLDFGRAESSFEDSPDVESISGLENILRFLMEIQSKSKDDIIERANLIKREYLEGEVMVVPENKYQQYEDSPDSKRARGRRQARLQHSR